MWSPLAMGNVLALPCIERNLRHTVLDNEKENPVPPFFFSLGQPEGQPKKGGTDRTSTKKNENPHEMLKRNQRQQQLQAALAAVRHHSSSCCCLGHMDLCMHVSAQPGRAHKHGHLAAYDVLYPCGRGQGWKGSPPVPGSRSEARI